VRSDRGLIGASGLHTGSSDRYVEGTADIHEGWGLAWGSVAPEIERAAVRTEQGELFPANIVALPPEFGEPNRAAWGLAERCEGFCTLIGYDPRGNVVEPDAVRPRERLPLTPEARLARVRELVDSGLRYYATAYPKVSEDDQERFMNYMFHHADVLALIEQDATDPRLMMSWRSTIIDRYLEAANDDPWRPHVCSFCGEGPAVAWYEGPDFTVAVTSPYEVHSSEAWVGCAECVRLVEANDRDELVARGVKRLQLGVPNAAAEVTVRQDQDERFWAHRTPG
jgi:hypothetical protein